MDLKIDGISDVVQMIRTKFAESDEIIDITEHETAPYSTPKLAQASGFRIRNGRLGLIVAIKPEAICRWVPGYISLLGVLEQLDVSGELIHGADGKRTRQVVIGGLGRRRFYCFKTSNFDPPAVDKVSRREKLFKRPGKKNTLHRFDWNDE